MNVESKCLGCEACKKGAYGASWPPPQRIAEDPDYPSFLHRCELCGTYWDFELRFANPITEDKARERFPFVFKQIKGTGDGAE